MALNRVVSVPIQRKKLTQQIYDALESQILTGTLPPGTKLSEGEVAEVFDVSRSPAREAIKELERIGFATRVGPRDRVVAKPTVKSIRDFFQTWWILDAGRTYQASLEATEPERKRLLELIDELEAALDCEDKPRAAQLTEEFHGLLYGRTPNKLLEKIAAENQKYLAWLRQLYLENVNDSYNWRKEHRAIVLAFLHRDLAGLIDALRAHILRQGEEIIRNLEIQQELKHDVSRTS